MAVSGAGCNAYVVSARVATVAALPPPPPAIPPFALGVRYAWSLKTQRSLSLHCRGARVYGHTTMAMHETSPPPPPPRFVCTYDSPRFVPASCNVFAHFGSESTARRAPASGVVSRPISYGVLFFTLHFFLVGAAMRAGCLSTRLCYYRATHPSLAPPHLVSCVAYLGVCDRSLAFFFSAVYEATRVPMFPLRVLQLRARYPLHPLCVIRSAVAVHALLCGVLSGVCWVREDMLLSQSLLLVLLRPRLCCFTFARVYLSVTSETAGDLSTFESGRRHFSDRRKA